MYFEIVKNIFVHHTSMINIDKHIHAIVFHLLNNNTEYTDCSTTATIKT